MPDVTLCKSQTCRARTDCRRNPACPTALAPHARQAWALFHPRAGYACPMFWDARGALWPAQHDEDEHDG